MGFNNQRTRQGASIRVAANSALQGLAPRLGTLVALGCAAFALVSPVAASAEPAAFTTTTRDCSSQGSTATFPVQDSAHSDTILEYQSNGASGTAEPPFRGGASFAPGDSGAVPFGEVSAGTAPQADIFCDSSDGLVSLAIADRPSTPATFGGTTSPGDNSWLSFIAPGEGQYEVNVAISQGAITIDGVNGIIESSGSYPLGDLSAGDQDLDVQAQNGPPAIWTATVREVPVAINGLTFGQEYITSGSGVAATFSVTGDTTVSASIVNSLGTVVRSLGSFPVSEGQSSVPWDGRGQGGAALPDGAYYMVLVSSDPSGDSTRAYTKIVLDNTPPAAVMTSPTVIGPGQSVAFDVTDAESGVSVVTITIGRQEFDYGGESSSPISGNGAYVFSTRGAIAGLYRWQITATDAVGNSRTVHGTFRIETSKSASKYRRAYVNCLPAHGREWLRLARPGSCDLLGTPPSEANLILLRKARWSSWGTAVTTGTGRALNTHPGMGGPASVPVSVRLYRLVRGCHGYVYYSRVRATTAYGQRVLDLPTSCDTHF
jgi:hypothetical protein